MCTVLVPPNPQVNRQLGNPTIFRVWVNQQKGLVPNSLSLSSCTKPSFSCFPLLVFSSLCIFILSLFFQCFFLHLLVKAKSGTYQNQEGPFSSYTVATFLCKGLSAKILQNPNLSFHKINFPTELNEKQGERGEVSGHIHLPVLVFKQNLSIKNNKECKIHNKAFWWRDCIKLWETGMISTFWSPVKSSALMPSANPSQLGVVHQHWSHSHEPIFPHPIYSYLTCSGYMTSPVNLKICFKLLCSFSALQLSFCRLLASKLTA